MSLPDFIAECDAFCSEFDVSRVWLSKRLFSDTFRIETLAGDKSDVGVRRLEKARGDLARLRTDKTRDAAHLKGTTAPAAAVSVKSPVAP